MEGFFILDPSCALKPQPAQRYKVARKSKASDIEPGNEGETYVEPLEPSAASASVAPVRVPNTAALTAIAELEDAFARLPRVPLTPEVRAWLKAKFSELRAYL